MSKYKNRIKPVSRYVKSVDGFVSDGDLFVPNWPMIKKDVMANRHVMGVRKLIEMWPSMGSCILEFRWDYKSVVGREWGNDWAKLFVVRPDGKRLDSNIFLQGRIPVWDPTIMSYLIRYDGEKRAKKVIKIKRSWS